MQPDRLAEVDAVFDEALNLDLPARIDFLDRRCGSDVELRRAVESLFAHAEGDLERWLAPARGLVEAAAALAGSSDALPDAMAPGSMLGPYRVVRTLGRGGMGLVLLAERSDGSFERQVAIKVLPHLSSSEAVRRFERERQILARLSHPNIAHLVDGGIDPRGLPYLVMEHVEGRPVDRHCDDARLGVDERLRLVAAIARAVHAAHRSLVIHRDIKPSNVLIGAGGVVKLLDFGIAKLLDPLATDGAPQETARLMTPTYASPEQVRGLPITTSTDVYQLGLLLYELLTGRQPQSPATTGSLADLVRVVCERSPAPPSRAVLETPTGEPTADELARRRATTPVRLARRCRGDLDAVAARALDKDPERRYSSAEELATDLERHLDGRPVRARRATFAYRARTFLRRNLAASLVAGLALALTVGYAVAVTFQARQIARQRSRAELEAEKARQVEQFVLGLFEVSDPRRSRGEEVTARDLLTRGAERADAELAGQPEVQARMLSTLGLVHARLGLLDEGVALQRRSLALRREHLGDDDPETAESILRLGAVMRRKGDHAAARPLLVEALEVMRRQAPGSDALASALTEVATLRFLEGEHEAARTIFTESLAVRRVIGDPAMIATGLNGVGMVAAARGDFTAAVRHYREALALNRATYGERHPAVAVGLFNLARVLQDTGNYAAAQPLFEEVLAIDREAYGPDHPEIGNDLSQVANNLEKLGELERAEPLLAEAMRIYEAKLHPEHTLMASLLHTTGSLRLAQGRLDEAEQLLRRSLAIRRRNLGVSHTAIGRVLSSLGECLARQGRLDDAEAVWREALPMVAGGKLPLVEKRVRAGLAEIGRPPANDRQLEPHLAPMR